MYILEYSNNGGLNWLAWVGHEENESTPKQVLKDVLQTARARHSVSLFRYVRTVKVEYQKTIIIS